MSLGVLHSSACLKHLPCWWARASYLAWASPVVISLCSLSQMTWLAGMEGIAADYRHMEGYGVNTFTLINSEGKDTYVKFHWRPRAGVSCFPPLFKRLFPRAKPARAICQGHVCYATISFTVAYCSAALLLRGFSARLQIWSI